MDNRLSKCLYWIAALGILGGFVLSIISYLNVCSGACGGTHDYKLCGLSFECYGLIFFPILGIFHYASWTSKTASFLTGLLLAMALGSEIDFILIQKYEIKSYCPICLSIAACIAIAALAYFISYIIEFKRSLKENQKDEIMKNIKKALATTSFMIFGFVFALIGVVKENPLAAAEKSIKENVALGNLNSEVEVYLFSDWQCPACRALEPTIEKLAPKIMGKARLVFVDTIVHKETLNFIPYNLAFAINHKAKYMELRSVLTKISATNGDPSEEQIEEAIAPLGIKYKPLSYSDIAVGTKYYAHLVKQFDIEATPTMVIIHRGDKKGKRLMGSEINEENVMQAIDSMSK